MESRRAASSQASAQIDVLIAVRFGHLAGQFAVLSLWQPLSLAEKVANVELAYYRQADQFVFSAQEVLAWYQRLAVQEQAALRLLPPPQWLRLSVFIRPALEKRGYSLRGYMAAQLTQEEWAFWRESGQSLVAC